ncbi:hypothetical protein QJQ45_002934 [Haematococcus lacustris]|nr:hypothetical protein QJQ45_002934 [Haematococcus lacustris]
MGALLSCSEPSQGAQSQGSSPGVAPATTSSAAPNLSDNADGAKQLTNQRREAASSSNTEMPPAADAEPSDEEVNEEVREEDLLSSSDISLEKREALTRFQRLRQTPNMCSPEEALADIHLTSLIGSGGFASVFSGLWHGSGHVAVKICCTRPKQDGQFPARVLMEAIICKGLAHPSIIQTFEVRCCRVSPGFLDKVYPPPLPSPSPPLPPEAQGGAAAAGFASLHTAAASSSAAASALFSCPPVQPSQTGLTPLQPDSAWQAGSKSNSVKSVDEFGALVDTQTLPPVSWAEILDLMHVEAGQMLTILIMHRAKLGNLWQAIQRNLFEPRPELPAVDRRKRTRALLRTACEIAGGLEYLHMNDIIHADLVSGWARRCKLLGTGLHIRPCRCCWCRCCWCRCCWCRWRAGVAAAGVAGVAAAGVAGCCWCRCCWCRWWLVSLVLVLLVSLLLVSLLLVLLVSLLLVLLVSLLLVSLVSLLVVSLVLLVSLLLVSLVLLVSLLVVSLLLLVSLLLVSLVLLVSLLLVSLVLLVSLLLKPGNVLLNDSRGDARGFCAAVSDFGLSTLLDPKASDCQREGGGGGTLQYMSPEVLAHKHMSKASDVYAFGILVLEMARSGPAYSKACLVPVAAADLADRVINEDLRPEWPAHVCPELGKLYQQ